MPGIPYHFIHTTEVDDKQMPKTPGGINGGMMERDAEIPSPFITIGVDDMAAAVAKLKEAGGKIVRGPFPVADMGIAGYFEDTEGNILGLWQSTG